MRTFTLLAAVRVSVPCFLVPRLPSHALRAAAGARSAPASDWPQVCPSVGTSRDDYMCADATMLRNDLAGDTVVRDGWKLRRGGGDMRMGLRGMKAIEGNMIQAMARLKNPAKK